MESPQFNLINKPLLKKRIFFLVVPCILISKIYADCNFKSGSYIDELLNPKFIQNINIEVPKSSKFSKNAFKIFISEGIINPKLKKRFNAIITINYDFGSCIFTGKVRQSGDWKDHIELDAGNLIRSLDVKLNEGNILRAVRFKLLIPDTRNGINEVLGALFLRELGIMAPETFEVNTNINGIERIMLFQENSEKELLERNFRREGAIFEGDESILWSFEDYEVFELEKMALSRMINDNWFLKGSSSQEISLNAYKKLQYAYLNFHVNNDGKFNTVYPGYGINPNSGDSKIFPNYFFILYSMNGYHALRPHNQKFYFNPFLSEFEPIYYDGMLEFEKFQESQNHMLKRFAETIERPIDYQFIELIKEKANSDDLKTSFFNRVIFNDDLNEFFENAMSSLISNVDLMLSLLTEVNVTHNKNIDRNTLNEKYKLWNLDNDLNQEIYVKDNLNVDNFIITNENDSQVVSSLQLSTLLSKNLINSKRAILTSPEDPDAGLDNFLINTENFNGFIYGTSSLEILEDKENKIIKIVQMQADDWILINNVDISDWSFVFVGISPSIDSNTSSGQRFNKFGFTGCLNFHGSFFNNNQIEVISGGCEDSLNIVNSDGQIRSIKIRDAYADAIDIDFAEISVDSVIVNNAGNDCFDVSGGIYEIVSFEGLNCSDKGLSIGENSEFFGHTINVNFANIGVSSKDLSKVFLKEGIINAINCFESSQKKQEFGGSRLHADSISCEHPSIIDGHSLLDIKKNEF